MILNLPGERKHMLRSVQAMVMAIALVASLLLLPDSAWAPATEITSPGPLTRIIIGDDLNCQVFHIQDYSPEFYSDIPGACATLMAAGGVLYGPSEIPAGSGANPRTPFTPVSQTSVTGKGTYLDPLKLVTVVDSGESGLRLTETDSYVIGEESYRTDVDITNQGSTPQDAVLYRAADCFLQNSDASYGFVGGPEGSVGCSVNANNSPSGRIEQWVPITGGNNYYQAGYHDIWQYIGTQGPFPDTCQCEIFRDNGAGLSWSMAVPAGGTIRRSHFTTFSPEGGSPLTVTKTADSASSSAGGTNGYTITVSNPNPSTVSLNSISDLLPDGFSYTPGSTTGVTTGNPSISGQTLDWGGPFSVPAADSSTPGEVSLHFGVTVSSTPGQYFNNATADAAGTYSVVSTGDTAPVEVTGLLDTVIGLVNPGPSGTPTPSPTPSLSPRFTPGPADAGPKNADRGMAMPAEANTTPPRDRSTGAVPIGGVKAGGGGAASGSGARAAAIMLVLLAAVAACRGFVRRKAEAA